MSSEKIVVYRARTSQDSWRKRIEKIEVDRLTEKTFWMDGKRHPRKSDDKVYRTVICDTFEGAKQAVIAAMGQEIDLLNQQIQKARDVICDISSLDEASVPTSTEHY